MKRLICLFVLLGAFQSFAQQTIKGVVTDTNNEQLLGVEVFIEQLHKGTSTNENGAYELHNVPNGTLKITFSYLGYNTVVKEVTVSSSDITLDVQLKEAVFQVDEIIISTPFNKLQSDNVMKVERLSAKALQRTGAPTLIQGIETLPGFSQISTGVGIGKPVIRGLSGNRVLVYTQGIRLENQQYGDEHGLGVNGVGIESVELIKGPASLLYGSDALGGVLYINPETFAQHHHTEANFLQQYFSNTQGTNSSLGFKTTGEAWKFLARGTYAAHADYLLANGDRVTNTRFNEKDVKLGLGYNKNSFATELRYNFNRSEIGLTHGIEDQSTSKDVKIPYQLIDNHMLSLHSHYFFGKSKLNVDLGYTFNDRNEFEEHEEKHEDEDEDEHDDEHEDEDEHGDEAALQMELKTFTYNVNYNWPITSNTDVIFGMQGISQTNRNFGEEILIPNADINDIGFYSTLQHQWNNNAIQFGVRFDNRSITTEYHEVEHHEEHEEDEDDHDDHDDHDDDEEELIVFNPIDKTFNSFTASFGYKTELANNLTARFNAASGFRAPNLAELTSNGVHHGTNRFEVGNANLNNEKNLQLDLALEYKSDHFEWFVNGFYNHINDYIFISPTGEMEEDNEVFSYLQEDAKLYGGEIGVHIHPHPLDWLHLESSFEMVVGKQDNGDYLPLIPANIFKNTLRTEFNAAQWLENGFATLTLSNVFEQDNVSSFETRTPGYSLVDLGFGGDVKLGKMKFTTNLSINNLFDKGYTNHLSRLKGDGIPNPGRNFTIGIDFKI